MNGLYTVKVLIDQLQQRYSLDDHVVVDGCVDAKVVVKDLITGYGSNDIQVSDHQINQIMSLLRKRSINPY